MECFFPLMRRTRQFPEYPVHGKATLEKWGTNPTDDPLQFVVGGLLDYFKGFPCLHDAKEKIKAECDIKKEDKYWPIEDIEHAWLKAQTMGRSDKKHWAYVIMLQVMKYLYHDHQRQADSNFHESDESYESYESYESDDSENSEEEEGRTVETVAVLNTPKTDYEKISFSQLSHNELKANPSEDELKKEDGPSERVDSKKSETIYIKIPLSQLFQNEISEDADPINPNLNSKTYKLIDGCPSDPDIVRKKHTYVVAYDNETKNAKWVYEIFNKSTLANNNPGKIQFGKCMQNPGYDQGHLAAASNHRWCQEAYNSTYVFSNISPQHPILNSKYWNALEMYCRRKIKKDQTNVICNVHVYTGPILKEDGAASEDENTGPELKEEGAASEEKGRKKEKQQSSRIVKKVPTAFFKVIIVENVDGTVRKPRCFLIPNDEEKLKDCKKNQNLKNMAFLKQSFHSKIEVIERRSGLKFRDETFKGGEMDSIRTVTWTGEDGNGEMREAKIEVRINKPQTSR